MLDIAIIGGGPAGLSAGIYCMRGGVLARLYEEMFTGGQIVKTHRVDNYPGFSEGPDGFALGAAFETHAVKLGLNIEYAPILKLTLSDEKKVLTLPSGEVEAKCVILCMGANPRPLGIDRENDFVGSGISYCATCDGAFYRNKTVAVIGGGDTAVSDAIYLSALCKKVYLIHRREQFRASEQLQKTAFSKDNIELVLNSTVEELVGEKQLSALTVKNKLTGEHKTLEVDGAFVAVGIVPRTELVRGQVELLPDGSVKTDEFMQTNIKGVFAAGDIRNTPLRQVITACADGAIAATRAMELC
ncbi:MAG: thioredoxin-disulfide reductase [Clostridia bacterium]|nr:thioredoxin-disulfide reductase [Clostridia bacterium]